MLEDVHNQKRDIFISYRDLKRWYQLKDKRKQTMKLNGKFRNQPRHMMSWFMTKWYCNAVNKIIFLTIMLDLLDMLIKKSES